MIDPNTIARVEAAKMAYARPLIPASDTRTNQPKPRKRTVGASGSIIFTFS